MEASLAMPLRDRFVRRAAPICCGAALAGSAAFLSTHNPAAAGARYPGCIFHQATGLWCPGCGLTRGTYELMHGHLGTALGYNVFTPLVLVAIAVAWVLWMRRSWGATPVRLPRVVARSSGVVALGMVMLYGVLRNIPVGPLRALAP